MLLPINYAHEFYIDLDGPEPPPNTVVTTATSLNFYCQAEHTWATPDDMHYFWSYSINTDAPERVSRNDISPKTGAAIYWSHLIEERPWMKQLDDVDGLEAEFESLFIAISTLDKEAATAAASRFKLDWYQTRRVDYASLYMLVVLLGMLAGVIWLGRVGVRQVGKAEQAFNDSVDTARQRYGLIIEENGKRMPRQPG